jgi:chloramphenicol 3-O phosphotransferase
MAMPAPGQIVILNGAPRSGKSSIAKAIQERFDGAWINLGVDVVMAATPARYQPGIGLRPGGERPDLEPFVQASYAAVYDSIAAHARAGLNVVADFGHHDAYARPLGILPDCARRLTGLPVLFVGVRCPIETIMARRNADPQGRYVGGETVPEPVRRWQEKVHEPGIYDLEVDTSVMLPEHCAEAIRGALGSLPKPSAFERLAGTQHQPGAGELGKRGK